MKSKGLIEKSALSKRNKWRMQFFAADNDDWLDATVEGVTVDGIPLDGHYLEHLIESLEEK